MHRNAALLHKQHRNDSCESRLYISFLCKWKFVCVVEQILNASVYFTHMESFFFFLLAGALLHANYRMPFWDLTS